MEALRKEVAELRKINKDYQEIVEHATEIIFKLDREGCFYFVSAEFERMLEYSNEEMKGRHFTSIIHPDDLQICVDTFRVLEENGRAESAIDFRVSIKSGGYRWVSCSAICMFDNEGEPSHTIGMAHDVTPLHRILNELRDSEKALRISEEQYRSLFEALSEGAVLSDENGMVIAANRAAEKIFERNKLNVLKFDDLKSQYRYIHENGDDFPISEHPSSVTLRTGASLKNVLMGIVMDEERIKWITINTEPIYYTEDSMKPNAVISSFSDITQSKHDREELLKNQRLLAIESERYIQATRAVAHAVVDAQEKERAEIGFELHDNVNQILSTVRLYLDLALLNEKDRVNLISKSAEGLTDAVSEIRKISHSLVPACLNDLGLAASIEDLLESVRATGNMKVEFYHRGEIEQLADKCKLVLFRIIQEQMTNVLKHAEASKLIVELIIDESLLSLSISDNGKGFDNTNGKTKKGVGLYNISNRTQLLNGKVNMITSPGNGCKLNILIPI